jgi:hypothetical protein
VYDYGGETGLMEALDSGEGFTGFNPEQQGDIVRKIYVARKRGEETPTLTALAEQIKNPIR